MFNNLTALAESTHPRLLSEDLARKIYQACYYVIIPCASALGIVGNVSSTVILTRQGFGKSSNILLLSLTVSNILLSIGVNNVPKYVCFTNHPGLLMFSDAINYTCYSTFMMFYCAYTIGVYASVIIPVLITGERILSIFFPFKAHLILTPRRSIVAVSCIYITTGIYYLYGDILSTQFTHLVVNGATVGALVGSDMYVNAVKSGQYAVIESTVNYLTGIIPLSLVTVGCVIIGLKITHITNKRRQLTSSQVNLITKRATLRSTKTLLSICVLYIVCNGFGFASICISQSTSLEGEKPVRDVILYVGDLLVCVNCVGDFLIYFRANNRFRKLGSTTSRLTESKDGLYPKT